MCNIFTVLTSIILAFFAFANLPANAHEDGTHDADIYNTAYDICLVKAAQEGVDFMGFLQTEEDVNDFCGCAAKTAVDVYRQDLNESALDTVIEQKALQCMQPYIKPFVTNTCLAAAADSGVTDMTQKCDCFGEQVEVQSANTISDFFTETDKYLEASAQYCHLYD